VRDVLLLKLIVRGELIVMKKSKDAKERPFYIYRVGSQSTIGITIIRLPDVYTN
jgi:hypothetical protein